ncbi:MAG: exo-alpha-sialidase [Alphaproteobacteria bacterium]|uniref:WD40/YVTN/BNR-like repeat-containing protein n=1 Tax=Marinobacter salarius TaxID=1420917 RepID=UPI0032EDAD1E
MMTKHRNPTHCLVAKIVVSLVFIAALPGGPATASETTLTALAEQTHFHGIAVDQADPSRIFLATHDGLFVLNHERAATRVSTTTDDFMGFTPHPTDPAILYGSGHPTGGGNLGFIVSTDGGKSWTKKANGVRGPVDFHQMTVSKADPLVVFGVSGGLQRSDDDGRSWRLVGPAPERLLSLAGSRNDANTLYAATQVGLLKSEDGGRSWEPSHSLRRPATAVHVTQFGDVFAFIVGVGLVQTAETALKWRSVSNDFGQQVVLHIATDSTNAQNLYVVTMDPETRAQSVLASEDAGINWRPLGTD